MLIGLAYAMEGEIDSLLKSCGGRMLDDRSGMQIYQIEPGILAYAGGVGKVNAAMSAQRFIDLYHPDWIVNAGVAGSFLDLPIGTVVAVESFVQHDVDTSPMGDPVGFVSTVNQIQFKTSDFEKIQNILRSLDVPFITGTVATGDVFMTPGSRADWIKSTFDPTLCEMEGGAVAQVCLRSKVNFTALKTVSDRLTSEKNSEEFFNFASAMEALNRVVLAAARALRGKKEELNLLSKTIKSFEVDHTTLLPGLYLSRRDGDVSTYDLRFKRPNTGDLLTNSEMHSVEHLLATILRNGPKSDGIVYFGPMGCQTGFYLLSNSKILNDADVVQLVKNACREALDYDGPMPGNSARECGNYANLSLFDAKNAIFCYLNVISDWTENRLKY